MVVVARVRLSHEQWSEIAEASGLPSRARQRIEAVLTNYRMFQQASAARRYSERSYFTSGDGWPTGAASLELYGNLPAGVLRVIHRNSTRIDAFDRPFPHPRSDGARHR